MMADGAPGALTLGHGDLIGDYVVVKTVEVNDADRPGWNISKPQHWRSCHGSNGGKVIQSNLRCDSEKN